MTVTAILDRLPPPRPSHRAPQREGRLPATHAPRPRWTPVALAAGLLALQLAWPTPARAQTTPASQDAPATWITQVGANAQQPTSSSDAASSTSGTPAGRLSFTLPDVARPDAHDGKLPLFFEADSLTGESGNLTRATGSVRLRQGGLSVEADELTHTQADNTAKATGHVRIMRAGNIFSGPELTLKLDTLEGEFKRPSFWFARTQAGGHAEHVAFLGSNRLRATHTSYSSCTPENTPDGNPGEPDWSLKTSSIYLDFDANEGVADNAVIWFKGVPILAAPKLTFPLNDARKSGWLPPSFNFDSKSGFELSVPYYWNIAPNKDMTVAPTLSTRRGGGLNLEYRYLGPQDEGTVHLVGLPDDRVALRERGLADIKHTGRFYDSGNQLAQTNYALRWRRVSDDNYWKDFPHGLPTLTPRLYDSHARVERQLNARNWGLGDSQTILYGGVQTWQTLRDLDPASDQALSDITAPYRREPQLGLRSRSGTETGLIWSLQGEFNRFTHEDVAKPKGNRVNAIAQISRPLRLGGLNLTPRLSLNSTSYTMDEPQERLRSGSQIPETWRSDVRTLHTVSLDSNMVFERPVNLFDRSLTQTLEPRLLYVRTPYRDQSHLPIFDSAPRDFNQYAIYSENAYTGVDRISDANQITMGVTTRLIDHETGAEALRLGIVQKLLLADQRINPDGDGPITERLSDLLLMGSTNVIPSWSFDSFMQFDAQNHQTSRGLLGVRYSPGAWRSLNLAYRYTRNASEQLDLGWQWPLAGRKPPLSGVRDQAVADPFNLSGQRASRNPNACGGTWYGVGRLSYSLLESRLTDSLLGIEYDAGCWIGRVIAERVSVGRSQASTRLMFQLELAGLSRISLGSNPLRTLKDNIPGYRLLHDDSTAPSPTTGSLPPITHE